MSYPYPQLLSLLQFQCTPNEYQQVTVPHASWRGGIKISSVNADYWQIIPSYTFAYCPVCLTRYHEPVDTYSIRGWSSYNFLVKNLYVSKDYYPTKPPCPHFLGMHLFLNLHDKQPEEVEYMENNTGEVPYITPWYFPDGLESYAVLHALPICRITNAQFIPYYTVFSIVYFSRNLDLLLHHLVAEAEAAGVKHDPEYYPATVWPPGNVDTRQYDESLYDLTAWAERGQLGWLDITEADQSLCLGIGMQLPEMYRQIEGKRWRFVWDKGRIKP